MRKLAILYLRNARFQCNFVWQECSDASFELKMRQGFQLHLQDVVPC